MPTVLITGANRGLGLEFARQYAADRWKVYATCRDPKAASHLVDVARAGTISVLQLDVTDPDSIARSANAVLEPIDLLINSAGVTGGGSQTFGKVDYDTWESVLRINTLGPMRVSEAFIEQVARSDRRLIVTITSGLASIAENTSGGWIAYRSSKAAVNMVMRSVAAEVVSRRITCVAVSPGWVQTDMGGPDAPLTPAESITAMRRLIEKLQPEDSGKFFSHEGREVPW